MEKTTDIHLQPGALLQVKRRTPYITDTSGFNSLHLSAGDFVIFMNCSTQAPIPGIAVANVIHAKIGMVSCLLDDLRFLSKRNNTKIKVKNL